MAYSCSISFLLRAWNWLRVVGVHALKSVALLPVDKLACQGGLRQSLIVQLAAAPGLLQSMCTVPIREADVQISNNQRDFIVKVREGLLPILE